MAGPAIRSYKLAIELSRDADVTLVVPYPTDIDPAGLEIVEDDPWEERRMSARVRGYDAVVAQCLPVATMRSLAKSDTIAIYDLYAPWLIEALPLAAHLPPHARPRHHRSPDPPGADRGAHVWGRIHLRE